jgi:hypothetical protein
MALIKRLSFGYDLSDTVRENWIVFQMIKRFNAALPTCFGNPKKYRK